MLNIRLTVSHITFSQYVNVSATQHKSSAYLPFCIILTAEARCQSVKTEVQGRMVLVEAWCQRRFAARAMAVTAVAWRLWKWWSGVTNGPG
jgi:hypothetical protein